MKECKFDNSGYPSSEVWFPIDLWFHFKRRFLLNTRNYLPDIQQNGIISLLYALFVQIKLEFGYM